MTPCFELSWKPRTPINAKHSGMTSAMQKRRACTRVEIPGGSPIPKEKSVGVARSPRFLTSFEGETGLYFLHSPRKKNRQLAIEADWISRGIFGGGEDATKVKIVLIERLSY